MMGKQLFKEQLLYALTFAEQWSIIYSTIVLKTGYK